MEWYFIDSIILYRGEKESKSEFQITSSYTLNCVYSFLAQDGDPYQQGMTNSGFLQFRWTPSENAFPWSNRWFFIMMSKAFQKGQWRWHNGNRRWWMYGWESARLALHSA
jgi:hypothetical protein